MKKSGDATAAGFAASTRLCRGAGTESGAAAQPVRAGGRRAEGDALQFAKGHGLEWDKVPNKRYEALAYSVLIILLPYHPGI
ncbi:MAG: hypothetical protein ACM3PP_00090 [Candidatus Saccharibacteria bacterium]